MAIPGNTANEQTYRLPSDIESLLAVAVRDAIWFKPQIQVFFKEAGISPVILAEAVRMYKQGKHTIPVVQHVLSELEKFGEDGLSIARRMLTIMHNWKAFGSLPLDQQAKAKKAIKDLKNACATFYQQLEYEERQRREAGEKRMHEERLRRNAIKDLDHQLLDRFRQEFEELYPMADTRERGTRFEKFMNDVFEYYSQRSEGPFRRTGEQLDGLFVFDNHPYYVEIRWKKSKANAADVSVLRDRAQAGFGGDTKALFLSFEGFSPECLRELEGRTDERVILMDGGDLMVVLQGSMGFDVLLAEKQLHLARTRKPFISVYEIMRIRAERKHCN
jgi:hypothetical protein